LTHARVGLFGGTFDPPHVGHRVLVRSAALALKLDVVRLIPSGQPWQKTTVATSAVDRLQMLRAAVLDMSPRPDEPWQIAVDDRETRRVGPTFTVETLKELRAEVGPATQLVWLMGADQFANLPTWHRWRELLDVTHLAVTARGPEGLTELPAEMQALLNAHGRDALPEPIQRGADSADGANSAGGAEGIQNPGYACGSIVLFRMPAVPISSTALRRQLQAGDRPRELLSDGVIDLIDRLGLYR
jgi:nicotinate-nucleotide adenylyltransferase